MYTYAIYTHPGTAPAVAPSTPPGIPQMPTALPGAPQLPTMSGIPPIASGHDYGGAFVTLAHGFKTIWVGSLATMTVAIAGTALATSLSKNLHNEAEIVIDNMVDKAKHMVNATTGDPCKYAKALASTTDSLIAVRKELAAANAALKAIHNTASSSNPGKFRGRLYRAKVASSSSSAVLWNAPAVTQALGTKVKQILLSGEEEGRNWSRFVNYSSLRYHRNLIGQVVIEGTITSTATKVTYKDLVLHICFISNEGIVLAERQELLPQFLLPGSSIHLKSKFTAPAHAIKITYELASANYFLAR